MYKLVSDMEGMYKSLLALAILALIQREAALAAQHVVGGSDGWSESTDFNSWVSGQTFKVGDQLVFKYTPGLHSVVELGGESAYKSCDIGSSLKSMNTGNDAVKLDKPGTRYFACGTSGHCDSGMKVKITTVAGNGDGSSSTTTPSSSSSTPSATSSAASAVVHPIGSLYSSVAAALLLFNILFFFV